MKQAVVIVVAVLLVLGGSILGLAMLGDEDDKEETAASASACAPGAAAIEVNVSNLPDEVAGYSGDALSNAAVIAKVANESGLGRDGQIVGLIVALQESDLGRNPASRTPNGDGDAGVFQQRTYDGWYGSLEDVSDVSYAAKAFFNGVTASSAGDYGSVGGTAGGEFGHIPGLKDVDGWEDMRPTLAASAVQKPREDLRGEYDKHVDTARELLDGLSDAEVNLDEASTDEASDGGGDECGSEKAEEIEASGDAASAIERAQSMMGTTYVFGGGDKSGATNGGVDCSGLVMYAYGLDTSEIGRTAQDQFNSLASQSIPVDDIQPGDLIFEAGGRRGAVGDPNSVSHVTMYIGDGQVIEASVSAHKVKTSPTRFDDPSFVDVRRIPSSNAEETS
ncbi:C40 family peptidase [Brachybacterium alimentarium]|uniref:C40 family peptidase n=1 Tax=Brachybacterium alimentarium TaxID=47845 RepID=UPI000DF24F25|nr:NlpC/P60 family protein [Brachybacterium alimentarium]